LSPLGFPITHLSRWDTSCLYNGPTDPAIDKAVADYAAGAAAFQATYQDKLTDTTTVAAALADWCALSALIERPFIYASHLLTAIDTENEACHALVQRLTERSSKIYSDHLVFFVVKLSALPVATLESLIADPALAPYREYLADIKRTRPFVLPQSAEETLARYTPFMKTAWVRLYEEMRAKVRVPYEGVDHTEAEIDAKAYTHDRAVRKAIAEAYRQPAEDFKPWVARVLNVLVGAHMAETEQRKAPSHWGDADDTARVRTMVDSIYANGASLAQRYYRLQARLLGLPKLAGYDTDAPLPFIADTRIPWDEAKRLVAAAYRAFDPRLGELVDKALAEHWIDACQAGKSRQTGAFSSPGTPDTHPFVFLGSYDGTPDNVMTLAHELGHAVHQWLYRHHPSVVAHPGPRLSETASIFGEMLTFEYLLSQLTDPKEKLALLVNKIGNMVNTIQNQAVRARFEDMLYTRRAQGELSVADIDALAKDAFAAMDGDAFEKPRDGWCWVEHHVTHPLYVYSYAYAELVVQALYAVAKADTTGTFRDRYLAMLAAGGSKSEEELLAAFGLSVKDPAFWAQGFTTLDALLTEAEALADQLFPA
jgi:oligoendopeptidase F